ncbi:MAG: hypothetical protein E7361_04670 [Clostridiales bacterium]|nr:hypothetical protein [Clostridiales bacterium]
MTYQEFLEYILRLENLPSLDYGTIGYSTLGEPIYYAHYGNYTGKQIIIEGSIHAREYLAGVLVAELARHTAETSPIIDGGIYFIPNINPDGVRLVLDGITDYYCPKLQEVLLAINDGNTDFGLWKANINGVDLNVNFDALWGGGSQNVFCLSSGNFVGYYPSSEREVRELIDFTNLVQPALTISYHTKGEVIYYGFETLSEASLNRDFLIGEKLSAVTGYTLVRTVASTGGYSDWVSMKLDVPAYTIEIGDPNLPHPLGIENLDTVFDQNKDVPITAFNAIAND